MAGITLKLKFRDLLYYRQNKLNRFQNTLPFHSPSIQCKHEALHFSLVHVKKPGHFIGLAFYIADIKTMYP